MGIDKAQGAPIRQNPNLFGSQTVKKAETKTAQPIQIVNKEIQTKELGRDLLTASPYAAMGVQFSQPKGVQTAERCLDSTLAVRDFAAFQGNFGLQNPQQAAAELASLGKTVEYMQDADRNRIAEHMLQFEAQFA